MAALNRYDIFVSYRRISFPIANLIATRLKAAGYRVFFDIEEMGSGPFNEQLYNVIEGCRDFLIVLPDGALDRCHDEEDWVRKEVMHAMSHKKNIIPIILSGFEWPSPMPKGMEDLKNYQGISASSIEFFDFSMQRLESYLKSRNNIKQRKLIKWLTIGTATLAILLLSMFLFFRSMAEPLCKEFADNMTMDVAVADFLVGDNKLLAAAMNELESGGKEQLYSQIEVVKLNIENYKSGASVRLQFSGWQKFLLSLHGINETKLSIVKSELDGMYLYIDETMKLMQSLAEKEYILPSESKVIESKFTELQLFANVLYYKYLQIMSSLPESVLEESNELRSKLVNMPKVALGAKEAEYDLFIKQEYERISGEISSLKDRTKNAEDKLYKEEKKLDSLNDAFMNEYRSYIEKCKIVSGDTPWNNWTKVQSASLFLKTFMPVYNEAVAEGDDIGSLTPEVILADLCLLLDEYKKCHHDAAFVPSVKEYYKMVAAGAPMEGVLVYAFAENCVHDVYKIGDIIVEWNGEKVKNRESLSGLYKKSSSGSLKLLRLQGSSLKELEIAIPGNEAVVAFVDL